MKLKNTKVDRSGNRYCGPLVLAAILGCTTAEATAKARLANDSREAYKGMCNADVIRTLKVYGRTVTEEPVPKMLVAARCVGEPKGVVTHGFDITETFKDGRVIKCVVSSERVQYCAVKIQGVTFAAWLKQRLDKAGTYLVNVTGHYVLVSGRQFVDTYTRGEWVNIGKAPHRRCRVEHVWRIT